MGFLLKIAGFFHNLRIESSLKKDFDVFIKLSKIVGSTVIACPIIIEEILAVFLPFFTNVLQISLQKKRKNGNSVTYYGESELGQQNSQFLICH